MSDETDIDRLIAAVERLSIDVPDLKRAIDQMEATLTATQQRTEEVEQSARTGTRSLRRRWILPLVTAVVVVAVLAAVGWHEQHRTAAQFEHVRAGLVTGCQATQQSNTALRTKNTKLLADARSRAISLATATAPDGQAQVLALLLASANADVDAYQGYLKAIPPPVDCQARYGR